MDDMENATLLPRKDDTTMIGKKNQSNVSLKNVAYGLGIVTLACSGSFVAGRSAARYKLSAASSSSQLGVAPRLGGDSKASVTSKHSTAHSAAAAKKAKKVAKVDEEEESSSETTEEAQPADPDTMSK